MSIKDMYLLNSFDALFTKKLMANTCAAAFLHKLEDQDLDRAAATSIHWQESTWGQI